MFRLKISKADKLFSELVREKSGWRCERCYTHYEPPTSSLHCSHFYGRGGKSTRFDFENVAALCYGCHRFLGSNPVDHREFFLKRLGQKRFDALVLRAHTPMKIDEKALVLAFSAEIKKIKSKVIGAR